MDILKNDTVRKHLLSPLEERYGPIPTPKGSNPKIIQDDWFRMFQDYTQLQLQEAVDNWLAQDEYGRWPTIGKLKKLMGDPINATGISTIDRPSDFAEAERYKAKWIAEHINGQDGKYKHIFWSYRHRALAECLEAFEHELFEQGTKRYQSKYKNFLIYIQIMLKDV